MWSPDARSVSATGRVSGFLCGQGAVDTNPSESLLRGTTVAVSLLPPPARSSAPGYRWGFLGCASGGPLQHLALTLSPPGRSPARPSSSFSSETWKSHTLPPSHQCGGLMHPPPFSKKQGRCLGSQSAQTQGSRGSWGWGWGEVGPVGAGKAWMLTPHGAEPDLPQR